MSIDTETYTEIDTDTDTEYEGFDDYKYLHEEELIEIYDNVFYNDDEKIDMEYFGEKNCGLMKQSEIEQLLETTFDYMMYNCSCGGEGDNDFLMLDMISNTDKKVMVNLDLILVLDEDKKYRYLIKCKFDDVIIPYNTGFLYYLNIKHYKETGFIIRKIFDKVQNIKLRDESKQNYGVLMTDILMNNSRFDTHIINDIIGYI